MATLAPDASDDEVTLYPSEPLDPSRTDVQLLDNKDRGD